MQSGFIFRILFVKYAHQNHNHNGSDTMDYHTRDHNYVKAAISLWKGQSRYF